MLGSFRSSRRQGEDTLILNYALILPHKWIAHDDIMYLYFFQILIDQTANMSKTSSIAEKQAPPKPCCSTLRSNTLPQIFLGITVGCLLAGLGVAGWFILNEFVLSSNETHSHDAFNSSSSSAVMNDEALRRESSHIGKSLGVSDNSEDIAQPNYDTKESENVVYLREPLYVGVLSLEQYLDTRAKACNETWGQNKLISKVEFFSHFTTDRVALPVVDLKGKYIAVKYMNIWLYELCMFMYMCMY